MMVRCLTVLVALVAQGMALMSPVCFVRCVSASGQEALELRGRACRCCDFLSCEGMPEVCAIATCGHDHEHEHDGHRHDEQDAPAGWQVRCEHCSCRHSPLESAPQLRSKSVNLGGVSDMLHVATLPTALDFGSVVRALENENCRPSLFRPQESPHLIVVATVVLRV